MTTDFEKGIKSKERVKNNGEVFTPKRIVVDMCDLPKLKDETYKIESKILEPSCGTGNFLVELLDRKMQTVSSISETEADFKLNMVRALTTLYGVDIACDNIEESRQRMKDIVLDHYKAKFSKDISDKKLLSTIDFVLRTNIILGDTLAHKMHRDYAGGHYELEKDGENELVFTEYVFDGDMVTMNECPITDLSLVTTKYKPINYLDMQSRREEASTDGLLELNEDGTFDL